MNCCWVVESKPPQLDHAIMALRFLISLRVIFFGNAAFIEDIALLQRTDVQTELSSPDLWLPQLSQLRRSHAWPDTLKRLKMHVHDMAMTALAASTTDYTVFQLAEPDAMNTLQTIQDSMTSILEEVNKSVYQDLQEVELLISVAADCNARLAEQGVNPIAVAEDVVSAGLEHDHCHSEQTNIINIILNKRECDNLQKTFEKAFCAFRSDLTAACSELSRCYGHAQALYGATVPLIQQSNGNRSESFTVAKKIQCYIEVLQKNLTVAEITACEQLEITTTALHVAIPALPSQTECNTSLVSVYPCLEAWVQQEYTSKAWYSGEKSYATCGDLSF